MISIDDSLKLYENFGIKNTQYMQYKTVQIYYNNNVTVKLNLIFPNINFNQSTSIRMMFKINKVQYRYKRQYTVGNWVIGMSLSNFTFGIISTDATSNNPKKQYNWKTNNDFRESIVTNSIVMGILELQEQKLDPTHTGGTDSTLFQAYQIYDLKEDIWGYKILGNGQSTIQFSLATPDVSNVSPADPLTTSSSIHNWIAITQEPNVDGCYWEITFYTF